MGHSIDMKKVIGILEKAKTIDDAIILLKDQDRMTNLEKVIKGLEECAGNGNCTKCQYKEEKQAVSCKKLLTDALELIKSERHIHTEHALYTVYERHEGEQNV